MYPEVRTGPYVLIAVTDTGEGMSDDVRQRAFEPFFTTKPTGAGTGLGLSMVYGFVKQSGGNVQLYSELGRGTSVRVFLPLAEGVQKTAGPTAGKADVDAMPGGSETILVVDDDPRLRRVVCSRLRGLGYQVIEADNAFECPRAPRNSSRKRDDLYRLRDAWRHERQRSGGGRRCGETGHQGPVHVGLCGAGRRAAAASRRAPGSRSLTRRSSSRREFAMCSTGRPCRE